MSVQLCAGPIEMGHRGLVRNRNGIQPDSALVRSSLWTSRHRVVSLEGLVGTKIAGGGRKARLYYGHVVKSGIILH